MLVIKDEKLGDYIDSEIRLCRTNCEKEKIYLTKIKDYLPKLRDEFPTNATYPEWVKDKILTVDELKRINSVNGESERTYTLLVIIVEAIINKMKGANSKADKGFGKFYKSIDDAITPKVNYKEFFQKNFATIIDGLLASKIYPTLVEEDLLTLQDVQYLNCTPNSERERNIQLVTLMMSKKNDTIRLFREKVIKEFKEDELSFIAPDSEEENKVEDRIREEEILKQKQERIKQTQDSLKQREDRIEKVLIAENDAGLNILMKELNDLESDLKMKETSKEDLKKLLKKSEDEVHTNEVEIIGLKSNLSSCKKETDKLHSLIQKQLEDINPIPDDEQLVSLKNQLVAKSLEIEKANKRSEVNEGNNRNLQNIIYDNETKINETSQQLVSLEKLARDDKEKLEKDRDGLRKQLKILTNSAEEEKKKIDEESDILWARYEELTDEERNLGQAKEKLKEEIRKYRN